MRTFTLICRPLLLQYSLSLKTNNIVKMSLKAALIDLSGTLHVEDETTPNAVEALDKLRATGIAIKFVTNTTKESSQTLYQRLVKLGFKLEQREIYSSLNAAAEYVRKHKLNPYYLVSKDARTDFPQEDTTRTHDAVVMGLAPDEFSLENLNTAFNILLANKAHQLIAIHQGKYYTGLEYATGKNAVLIGKPNSYFFESAVPDGVTVEQCVMIGDDPNDDMIGAMKVGLKGILVKTGKYLPFVDVVPPSTVLVENFCAAVEWIQAQNEC